ncbi:MAG: hypothetical protein M1305_07175 [Candidatus Marsarchaeota archaeon]|nr:hypothetical protein [Candidatus Marsarchaeota archaeon]
MLVQAEAFIRDTIREVLGKELEEISPVALITDVAIRRHLIRAEEALRDRNYSAATTEAAIAFAIGSQNSRFNAFPSRSWGDRMSMEFVRAIGEAASKAARSMRNNSEILEFAKRFESELRSFRLDSVLRELLQPIEMAQRGIDMEAYARFRQITPDVYWTLGGEQPRLSLPHGFDPSQQDALFAVDFTRKALLQLQKWMPQGEEGKLD